MEPLLRFTPLCQPRVWGGRRLAEVFGRALPDGPVGESWEVCDRPEAQTAVAGGALAGQTLREVLAAHGPAVMGPGWPAQRPFPLLVKWLDCRERLSLQVHPPAAVASALGGEPKTEAWFIAEAVPGAGVLAGLKRGVTRPQFEAALAAGALEPLVHRLPTRPGDCLFVPSGRIHAIDGGNLILEVQQNSDTTYRVYDWGRVGLDGRPRTLHVAESLTSIDFNDFEPDLEPARDGAHELARCEHFRMTWRPVAVDAPLAHAAGTPPALVHVVRGALAGHGEVFPEGTTLLLPFAGEARLAATAPGTAVVWTDGFA